MRLQPKDLMIDDWVYIKDYPIKALPQKVKPEHFVRSLVEFEPIPLTKEILEKNGWFWNNLPFEQCWEQYGLYLYHVGNGYRINCGSNISMIINSVHELQHVLKLCGIEKEIEL